MEESKIYYIGDREEKIDHDYTIEVIEHDNRDTEYVLSRSNSDHWSEHCKGEEIIRLVDDCNGYKFNDKIGKSVDYALFAELYILLQFISKTERDIYSGIIIEKGKTIEF